MSLRLIFILIMAIGGLVGVWGQFFMAYNPINQVQTSAIANFYSTQFYVTIFIGAFLGMLWGFAWTRKSVLHVPHETGVEFTSRVLRYGLKSMGIIGAVALLVACFQAARFDPPFGDNSIDRVLTLVIDDKSIAILCMVAPTMGLMWGSVIRTFGDWGGARALFGSSKGGN